MYAYVCMYVYRYVGVSVWHMRLSDMEIIWTHDLLVSGQVRLPFFNNESLQKFLVHLTFSYV